MEEQRLTLISFGLFLTVVPSGTFLKIVTAKLEITLIQGNKWLSFFFFLNELLVLFVISFTSKLLKRKTYVCLYLFVKISIFLYFVKEMHI